MNSDPWEEDIEWFLMRCVKDKRPKPSESLRDAFAYTVDLKIKNAVYPDNPVLKARLDAYEDYKNGRLHRSKW